MLELPMALLGFVWLGLLALELTRGLTPFLEGVSLFIWAVFIIDFGIKLTVAPDKSRYIRRNWLTLLSLVIPALRVLRFARAFRVLRAARAMRGIRLVKVLGSLNRGMRALRQSLGRKGFIYVAGLTLIVNLLGAAGIYAFERDVPDPNGIHDFGTALWWTAMMLTTMGSQYWPQTTEGRVLSLLLATYAFAIFGYITAAVASYFVGREESGSKQLQSVLLEIQKLRDEIRGQTDK